MTSLNNILNNHHSPLVFLLLVMLAVYIKFCSMQFEAVGHYIIP